MQLNAVILDGLLGGYANISSGPSVSQYSSSHSTEKSTSKLENIFYSKNQTQIRGVTDSSSYTLYGLPILSDVVLSNVTRHLSGM